MMKKPSIIEKRRLAGAGSHRPYALLIQESILLAG